MIKKILLLFLISPLVHAECGSVVIKQDNLMLSFEIPTKNQSVKTFITSPKHKVEDAYYCMLREKVFKCVGDDGGGTFFINKEEQTIKIDRISSGNPDEYRFEIDKKEVLPYVKIKCDFKLKL